MTLNKIFSVVGQQDRLIMQLKYQRKKTNRYQDVLGVTKVWPSSNWGVMVTLKGHNLRGKKHDKTCCVHNII